MLRDPILTGLQSIWPNAVAAEEGGIKYYLLPQLDLPEGCTPGKVDALLCPVGRDGYPSRLYFAVKIECGVPHNWNGSVQILDRTWVAISWKTEAGLDPIQMVRVHLRAFKSTKR